jgi:hypothetical protein
MIIIIGVKSQQDPLYLIRLLINFCFRVVAKGYTVIIPPDPYNSYIMMNHTKDKPNPDRYLITSYQINLMLYLKSKFYLRFNKLASGKKRFDIEGLNTLKYKLIKIEKNALYTNFLVYSDQAEYLSRKF